MSVRCANQKEEEFSGNGPLIEIGRRSIHYMIDLCFADFSLVYFFPSSCEHDEQIIR